MILDPWKQLLGRLYEPLVKEWLLRNKQRRSLGGMGEHAFRTVTPELLNDLNDEATATHHYRELLRERRGQT